MEGIHVFDVVAPPLLPDQLVAEAQRIADVPLALYVLDIDGSHLLRVAGPDPLPERIEAPLAIGPELDSAGLAELRETLSDRPGIEVIPLWLRGRAIGAMLATSAGSHGSQVSPGSRIVLPQPGQSLSWVGPQPGGQAPSATPQVLAVSTHRKRQVPESPVRMRTVLRSLTQACSCSRQRAMGSQLSPIST
jgi:hypothetical protein